jgi:hypothetical protein
VSGGAINGDGQSGDFGVIAFHFFDLCFDSTDGFLLMLELFLFLLFWGGRVLFSLGLKLDLVKHLTA